MNVTTTRSSVRPLEAPFDEQATARLNRMMRGTGLAPLSLFRLLVRHPAMVDAMAPWGAHTLGPTSTLDAADREVVIQRTCARLDCEYEWGVHATVFAPAAGVSAADSAEIATRGSGELSSRAQLLIRLADELHETAAVSDQLWAELEGVWSGEQLLDLLVLAGWYHAICFVANAAQLAPEPWAARFPTGASTSSVSDPCDDR
jgi:4-carboxymuconolactone decarboxylase